MLLPRRLSITANTLSRFFACVWWLAPAYLSLNCGAGGVEYRYGHTPRADPRLVLAQGTDAFRNGGITVELDEPGYLAVFVFRSDGFVRLFYPYLRNQETYFTAGSHRIRGDGVEGPLAILVSVDPIELDRLDQYIAETPGAGPRGRNPGNAYRATYDLERGALKETLEALPQVLLPAPDEPTWALYYYSRTSR